MQTAKRFLIRVSRIYLKSIEWSSAVLMVLVTLAMLETVFSRAVLRLPLSAIDRINISLMIWICFMVNGILILENKHIQIDILPGKLKGARLSILRLLINLSMLAICTITTIYGYEVTMMTYETGVTYTAEIDIPQWPTFLAVSVGMALAVPSILYLICKDVQTLSDHMRKRRG